MHFHNMISSAVAMHIWYSSSSELRNTSSWHRTSNVIPTQVDVATSPDVRVVQSSEWSFSLHGWQIQLPLSNLMSTDLISSRLNSSDSTQKAISHSLEIQCQNWTLNKHPLEKSNSKQNFLWAMTKDEFLSISQTCVWLNQDQNQFEIHTWIM